jgi:uncharacterized protein (DUF1330 family)
MSVVLIAFTTINTNESEALQAYIEGATPLVEAAGGKVIARYQAQKTIIGDSCPQFVSILEYPSTAAIEELFASEAYAKLKQFKDKAFTSYEIGIYEVI